MLLQASHAREENNYGTLARYKRPSSAHSFSSRTPQFNYSALPSLILPCNLLAMFARLPVVFLYAFVAFGALVAALPGGHPGTTYVAFAASSPSSNLLTETRPPATTTITGNSCSSGPVQCCNSVQQANSQSASLLLGLLGIVLQDLSVLVGLGCTPITVIGAGGNECSSTTVCCENNNFNGLINIGCTPINIL
ncbi:SC3 hydrophobin [Schizophyllum commune]